MKFYFALAVCSFIATALNPLEAKLTLGELFGDNMVLQRDTAAPVWGTADPAEVVKLTLGDQTVTATADAKGAWQATFQGLKLGPPQTLTIAGAHDTLTLHNVAVGDVWVTSGQSNMQYLLIDQDEIATPPNPNLRYFECPRAVSPQPANAFPPRAYPWVDAEPQTRAKWSAVAYYFAKNVNKELGVPIGIIDCTWGGTPAEPWTARQELESVPEYKEGVDRAMQGFQNVKEHVATFEADWTAWEKATGRADTDNAGFAAGWAAPGFDASDWKPISIPTLSSWAGVGMPDGGAVWMRKTVTFPPDAAGKDFTLALGSVPGIDTAYFNGQEIGHGGWDPQQFARQARLYKVPGPLVKAGDNVIALRIYTENFRAYGIAPGAKMGLPAGATIDDNWVAKVEKALPPMTPDVAAQQPPNPYPGAGCVPSLNFNGMVCPLMPYAIKGALWYQGESNATYAYAYRTLLPLLIKSWRERWGIGDFPFYIVQLPNLGTPPKAPVEDASNWAVMRESQLMTWKKVPHTGMSVNIELGEAMNLHPHDKKDVGYRLSLIALGDTYGKPIEYSGPIYDSMTVEGDKVRIKFTHVGGGLVAKDGPLQRFAIAGDDKKWVPGNAEIDGDTVVVSSADVPAPVAVRYAWAGNPDGCNLYSKANLPASPFRTDDWQVITQGFWYPVSQFKKTDETPLAPLVDEPRCAPPAK
jgi:sialate O-acetylesterase